MAIASTSRRLREGIRIHILAMIAPYRGFSIVTCHRSWHNLAERFGLDVIGYVEPRPGIPLSAAHTRDLIQEMRRQNV